MNRKQRRVASKQGRAGRGHSADIHAMFDEAVRHHGSGRLDDAERLLRQILAVEPRHAGSLNLRGVIAYQSGNADRAFELISASLAINPMAGAAQSNLGNLLLAQGRFEEAAARYRRALELRPELSTAANTLGTALRAMGRIDEAIDWYHRCLELTPNYPEAHNNLGMALLEKGDWTRGWEECEWRWMSAEFGEAPRDFRRPQWRGEAAAGRTLLIHAEQGFGDTLQFCRYAPMAAARGLRVILEAPKPLARLLGSLAGVDRIVTTGEALPPFDLHCPMMSLPLAFGTTLATVPGGTPYLSPDRADVAAWSRRLDALARPGPRVGLVWAGNPRKRNLAVEALDRRRSISPDRLSPLFEVPGLHFFSLQKDGPAPPPHLPLIDVMTEIRDFADTAALVANLDLIISVDTAVAHLGGALGQPVWLLNRYDTCWRWMRNRDDSVWYPLLRQFRQPAPGDWDSAISEAQDALRIFAAGAGNPRRPS